MENITKIIDACLPDINNLEFKDIQSTLGCFNAVSLNIDPKPHALPNRCHANVERQVQWYGGEKIQGYYIAVSESTNKWTAIKHSVWKKEDELIDITPVNDDRTKNIFVWGNDQLHTSVYFDGVTLHKDDTLVLEQVSI